MQLLQCLPKIPSSEASFGGRQGSKWPKPLNLGKWCPALTRLETRRSDAIDGQNSRHLKVKAPQACSGEGVTTLGRLRCLGWFCYRSFRPSLKITRPLVTANASRQAPEWSPGLSSSLLQGTVHPVFCPSLTFPRLHISPRLRPASSAPTEPLAQAPQSYSFTPSHSFRSFTHLLSTCYVSDTEAENNVKEHLQGALE